jgi:hypothetical protein
MGLPSREDWKSFAPCERDREEGNGDLGRDEGAIAIIFDDSVTHTAHTCLSNVIWGFIKLAMEKGDYRAATGKVMARLRFLFARIMEAFNRLRPQL